MLGKQVITIQPKSLGYQVGGMTWGDSTTARREAGDDAIPFDHLDVIQYYSRPSQEISYPIS